ncbi:hypothetical protein, partial [Methylobacterium sp. WL12]|uniref:hypothetical protein n=1 Tax=Methylobacterium sp. WL12 TaxID=2603890 RepID=UPI001AEDF62D
ITNEFFLENTFNLSTVNTKTFILLLASLEPRSFISGQNLDLKKTLKDSNRTEYHHLMPRSFVKTSAQDEHFSENVLANFCFLSRADNRKLGGDASSVYKQKMSDNVNEILTSALCTDVLFSDDFLKFSIERNKILYKKARQLCLIDEIITAAERVSDMMIKLDVISAKYGPDNHLEIDDDHDNDDDN